MQLNLENKWKFGLFCFVLQDSGKKRVFCLVWLVRLFILEASFTRTLEIFPLLLKDVFAVSSLFVLSIVCSGIIVHVLGRTRRRDRGMHLHGGVLNVFSEKLTQRSCG